MRLLLDTHTFLWWLDGDRRLSPRGRRAIAASPQSVWVSALSAWELILKSAFGRHPRARVVTQDVAAAIRSQGFLPLDITLAHVQRVRDLPLTHNDPFDRLLAAQSIVEGLHLVSRDEAFDRLGVARFW